MDSSSEKDVDLQYLHPDTETSTITTTSTAPLFPNKYPSTSSYYHLFYDQMTGQDTTSFAHDASASTSLLNEDTPSWSTLDGILSDKYRSDDLATPGITQPTQSTQDTIVQKPTDHVPGTYEQSPIQAYYSQPQFRERSFESDLQDRPVLSTLPARLHDAMSTPPRLSSTSSSDSFALTQRQRIAKLRRELLDEESKVITASDELAHQMRRQVISALKDDTPATSHHPGLDSSQQLSHSLLDEQSRTRLRIAKPDSDPPDPITISSVSVDLTPLTEDLLMNSRTDIILSDGARTISDGQFPLDDDEIIFTPLSDDDMMTRAFATPPRVVKRLDKKLHKPSALYEKGRVQLQSQGRVIGNTELGSFDETSSMSMADKENMFGRIQDRAAVKPLRRHAWSDSETENSLSKSLNKQQFEEIKQHTAALTSHQEKISTNLVSTERPHSAFGAFDTSLTKHRPYTAPSSEKVDKFEIKAFGRTAGVRPEEGTDSLDSDMYPNLKNSFLSLQNTIMSDIAALRREIVEKQEGTEKLKAEFSDFKHAYYNSIVEQKAVAKQKAAVAKHLSDAKIQTSQPPLVPVDEPKRNTIVPVVAEETSYSECDSETDRQLATLKALQRSLREQSNQRYLQELENKQAQRTANSERQDRTAEKVDAQIETHSIQTNDRSIQTTPKPIPTSDAYINTSDVEKEATLKSTLKSRSNEYATLKTNTQQSRSNEYATLKTNTQKSRSNEYATFKTNTQKSRSNEHITIPRRAAKNSRKTPDSYPRYSEDVTDSSMDSTERATREVFMDILRKKAEMDEEEDAKRKTTSTPKPPNLHAGIKSFTPASVHSDSTLTDDTFVADNEVTALDGLWKEFMKFVIQSKALKQHRSKSSKAQDPCIKVDLKKLKKLQETVCNIEQAQPNKEQTTRHSKKVVYPPAEMFDVSVGNCKGAEYPGTYTIPYDTERSIDSREERINRLITEIEEERRRRAEKLTKVAETDPELDEIPVRDEEGLQTPTPPPPSPPVKEKKKPVAFDISLDMESVTSEEVERAPGYPNMVFKTGKLQDAFVDRKRRFMEKSRRRALHIQLRKEARQKYAQFTPPERPRPTIDSRYFSAFDIPPPRTKVISRKAMRRHSKNIYEGLPEVTSKKHENKIERERQTYRLRAKLFNKRVQDTVLGKKYMNSVRVY